MEKIILVDEIDSEIGTMEKMEAHRKGVLAPGIFRHAVQFQW